LLAQQLWIYSILHEHDFVDIRFDWNSVDLECL
jgi:hypothetical protein